MMDPIDVATSLVGLLGSAGKVVALLVTVKKSISEAPQLMDQMIAQVRELEISLSAVQSFLRGISSAPRGRMSMIRVEQLVAILTEAVLTFSELEALVTSIAQDKGRLPIMSRLITLWKEDIVSSIMLRLERHKSSLSLMLNIAQCESDIEAEQSRETLQGLVEQLLRSNHEISLRLQSIEENFETRSVLTYCVRNGSMPDVPEEEPQNEPDSSRAKSDETDFHELGSFAFPQYERGGRSGGVQSGFQVDLGTSRVYMRTERYKSDVSFTSSAVRSHAWSVFTGLSLSEVSVISAIALPLYLDEIYNASCYTLTGSRHDIPEETKAPTNVTKLPETVTDRLANTGVVLPSTPATSSSNTKEVVAVLHTGSEFFQSPYSSVERFTNDNPLRIAPNSLGTGNITLYKLVILGDEGVGKTDLVTELISQRYKRDELNIVDDSFRKQVAIDGQTCLLEILDPAGQEVYTALRDSWIRDGDGFVFVYSITSRSSFTRIQKFYNQVARVKDSMASSSPVPAMLVGNKSDRVGIAKREVSMQEGHALAKELGCDFVEASAKNVINVEKAFYDVVRTIRRQRIQEAILLQRQSMSLQKKDDKSTSLMGLVRIKDQPLRRRRSGRD